MDNGVEKAQSYAIIGRMWLTILVVTMAAAICFSVADVIAQHDRISARFSR